MGYKDLAKDALIIGFTQVLVNVGNFLLLPVITKNLGTNDYGLWIQVLVTISLLSSVAMLGQGMTILRFLKASEDRKRISGEYFGALALVVGCGLILSILMIGLSIPLAELIFDDNSLAVLLVAAALIIPFSAFTGINNSYLRAMGKIKTYAALNIFNAFGEVGLILFFVIGGLGVLGAVLGSLLIAVIVFFIGLAIVLHQVGFSRPDREVFRRNLKFGLPLAPNTFIRWVISSSDRYLLAILVGLSLAGIYSAAYNIGGVIFLLVTPIQLILYPTLARLFDEGRIDDVKDYIRRSFRYYMMLTMPAVVGISVLAVPILVALTTPDYVPGAVVIPLVAIAGLFSGMFKFVENITHLVKKTHLNLITFGVPAIADVVMVIVLTPLLGIAGAALATTISYATMFIIGVAISRRFLTFSVEWTFVLKSVVASLVMAVGIILLDAGSMEEVFLAIIIGIVLYFGALYALKGFTRDELDLAMSYLRRGRKEEGSSPGRDE